MWDIGWRTVCRQCCLHAVGCYFCGQIVLVARPYPLETTVLCGWDLNDARITWVLVARRGRTFSLYSTLLPYSLILSRDLVRKSSCAGDTASAIVSRTSCMSARVLYSTRTGEVGRRTAMARAIVRAVFWYPAARIALLQSDLNPVPVDHCCWGYLGGGCVRAASAGCFSFEDVRTYVRTPSKSLLDVLISIGA